MDIHYFLRHRLDFIKSFYETASEPFLTKMKKIERVEEPFTEVDPEGGESPYQGIWNKCYEALDVLGQHCIGMLAVSLRLYLNRYIDRMNEDYEFRSVYKRTYKDGWLNGFGRLFNDDFKIDWAKAPAKLNILEQAILARNDFEHGGDISTMAVYQNDEHFKKYKDSFFADEMELAIYKGEHAKGEASEEEFEPFAPWHLNVSRDQLWKAIEEVRQFCDWLEAIWQNYIAFREGKDVPPVVID